MIPFISLHAVHPFARSLCVQGTLRYGAILALMVASVRADDRIVLNFNADWKFSKTDTVEAVEPSFDDHAWANVSTPHTYNDVDTFDDWSVPGHRGEQNQWAGRTWYRKTFALPESYRGKKVYIEFEAVRQVAEVYLNGKLLGTSKTGFTPFGFDLTPYLKFGDKSNVLAVICDNRFMKDPLDAEAVAALGTEAGPGKSTANVNLGKLSADVNRLMPVGLDQLQADQIPWNNPHWHPAHGGIYRNVFLHITDPLHISLPLYSFLQTAGPYIYSSEESNASARVTVEIPVINERISSEKPTVYVEIRDAEGQTVLELEAFSREIAAGAQASFEVTGVLSSPRFWEPRDPYLYRARCLLVIGGVTVDCTEISFGIRVPRWDASTGLSLNGHHEKLHGWGQKPTDEWPGLGAAQPDWLHFYTLALMKEAGGNFVRWGHCAGGPASITAGDRLGIIAEQPGVDGESDTVGAAWDLRASAFRDVLIYYRNHPSILIWEAGNQKVTHVHAKQLRDLMDRYDPHGNRANAYRRADQTTARFMDVVIGTEGSREIASLPVVEGEYDREESPRRVWDNQSPPNFGYVEAVGQTYPLNSEQFAVNEVAQYQRKLGSTEHAGGANWIFSDTTSGGRNVVEVARASGEVDGVRLPKEAFFACRALFRSDPQLHIIGHWNYSEGTKKSIYVVSNCDTVELFINGRSLGLGKVSDQYLFTFTDVAWEPGEIKAVAFSAGKAVITQRKHTVGPPVALRLTPVLGPAGFEADGADVALIDIEAVDATGERCPTFQQRVDFEFSGPAVWRGGYNSGKIKSTNNLFLDLECGINRVALRATRTSGRIVVKATSAEHLSGEITIEALAVSVVYGGQRTLPFLPEVKPLKTAPAIVREWGNGLAASNRAASLPPSSDKRVSRQVKTFSYSGPSSAIVHVEQNAREGKNAYVDIDSPFSDLPAALRGADWVQIAQRDRGYSAVDLIEISVPAGADVFVAHDDKCPRPGWLNNQFKEAETKLTVLGRTMNVLVHHADKEESLTLGSDSEAQQGSAENIYLVFVSGNTVQ
jgi:beta-galactosidase